MDCRRWPGRNPLAFPYSTAGRADRPSVGTCSRHRNKLLAPFLNQRPDFALPLCETFGNSPRLEPTARAQAPATVHSGPTVKICRTAPALTKTPPPLTLPPLPFSAHGTGSKRAHPTQDAYRCDVGHRRASGALLSLAPLEKRIPERLATLTTCHLACHLTEALQRRRFGHHL